MRPPLATRRAALRGVNASIRACPPHPAGSRMPLAADRRVRRGRGQARGARRRAASGAGRPVRHVRPVPAALPDLPDQPRRGRIAARTHRAGALRSRADGSQPGPAALTASGPVPRLPFVPEGLPVRGALRRDHHALARGARRRARAASFGAAADRSGAARRAGADRRLAARGPLAADGLARWLPRASRWRALAERDTGSAGGDADRRDRERAPIAAA